MDRLKLTPVSFPKIALFTSFLLLGVLSCGDEYFLDDVDCSECYVPKPDYGPVTLTLSRNAENDSIPILIFKGKYEESYLDDFSSAVIIDTVAESTITVDLPVNEFYSVAAQYIRDGKKVVVVDGDRLKLYKVSDQCDEICWIFRGGNIDVRLKK